MCRLLVIESRLGRGIESAWALPTFLNIAICVRPEGGVAK